MVWAILDGRKTVTRRVVKHNVEAVLNSPYHKEHQEVSDKTVIEKLCMTPYQPGDILYVRETWNRLPYTGEYIYKADDEGNNNIPKGEVGHIIWRPSIHMPKEAARIWLRVTDVRVERLQDITSADCENEGVDLTDLENLGVGVITHKTYTQEFQTLWDFTLKKSDLDRYGWNANPWVWVIEFERCEKPESWR